MFSSGGPSISGSFDVVRCTIVVVQRAKLTRYQISPQNASTRSPKTKNFDGCGSVVKKGLIAQRTNI